MAGGGGVLNQPFWDFVAFIRRSATVGIGAVTGGGAGEAVAPSPWLFSVDISLLGDSPTLADPFTVQNNVVVVARFNSLRPGCTSITAPPEPAARAPRQ